MSKVKIDIVTCPEWGARKPAGHIVTVPRSHRIIFHHTAGHHAEISHPHNESLEEAKRYARDIQAFHMGPSRGWVDSGHNFLVTRAGHILQGRWLTVAAIEANHMVISAHCPGFNTQVGIEHEHQGNEQMTKAQREASARLQAWIAYQYGLSSVLPVDPHSAHFPTSCPANLKSEITRIRTMAQEILSGV